LQAIDAVLVLAGGKADTPAGTSTASIAWWAAPERVFGRARKLARCKRRQGPHPERSLPTDADARELRRSPPLQTAPAQHPMQTAPEQDQSDRVQRTTW